MANDPAQKSALLRDFLDGSLPPEQRAEAEQLLKADPTALTLLTDLGKYETFVSRVREASSASNFPEEVDSALVERLRKAVLEMVKAPPATETASIGLNDPAVSTDSQAPVASPVPLDFLSPAKSADEIGRLNGYRILRQLGQGGMGLVFEAEDIRLKRRVALKVMRPEIAAKEHHRSRFVREAQTAAQVEHDHICPIYHVGEENGVPFIAMPFLKGEPLDVHLKRQSPLPIPEAICIAREVAEGLAVAHDAGLVHRDIKPGNIWLEARNTLPPALRGEGRVGGAFRVRILDFGLARLRTDDAHLTASGAILGTPAYMAPEQARGRAVDHRADLFSLGVMLYEMTTGRRPFTGDDTMSILTSLAVDEPPAPVLLNPEIPTELSDLIQSLLSKAPDKRPANARAVVDALTRTARPIIEALPAGPSPFEFDDSADVPRAKPAEPEAQVLKLRFV